MKKQILGIGLAAVMLLSAGGCSKTASSSSSSSAAGGSSSSQSSSSEAGSGALSAIKSTGVLKFALSGAYPPFSYYDSKGQLVGFDVDIGNALAQQLGVKGEPVKTDFDGIIAGLKAKRFDIAVASMAITPKRLQEISFTDPYYYDGAQFFTKEGTTLKSIQDLKNGKVGVCTGTTFQDALKGMSNIKQIVQFSSDVDNFMAVSQGRTDGLVTSRFVGLQAPAKYHLVACGPLLYSEKEGVAVRKEDTDLLAALNTALKTLESNGTYEKISDQYFHTNILK